MTKTKVTIHGFNEDYVLNGKDAEDFLKKLDEPLTEKQKEILEKSREIYKRTKQRWKIWIKSKLNL